jgi:hypothetical protein
MALKNEAVVDKWNTLVMDAAGRGKWVMEQVDKKLGQANLPAVRAVEREVSSGFMGAKRPFLIVVNDNIPDFYLYIGARDYGTHLDVSWYLTVQPSVFRRAFSKYSLRDPLAMSMQLDFFRQQDLHAFVTVVHHAVKDTVDELLQELGQNPISVGQQSKGILSVW